MILPESVQAEPGNYPISWRLVAQSHMILAGTLNVPTKEIR
jgi:hypothetical protein